MTQRTAHGRVRPDVTRPYAGTGSLPASEAALGSLRARLAPRTTTGALVGDYHLLARLARGGMSQVYLAERCPDRARVAIKLLHRSLARHPEVVARFRAERETARAAAHGGVVSMMGEGTTLDGVPYIVMELLEGESLADVVDRNRSLPIGAVAAIGAQLADTLAAVHAAGYVHCDLKPENAFVLCRGGLGGWPAVKLLDFGVARRITDTAVASTISGTPPYMAPEQWRGEPSPDGRSDVYGLGCVLHEMLTGTPPFAGASMAEQSQAHLEAMPTAPSRLRAQTPALLDRLVVRALAKDPALRPTMGSMASALTDLAFALPPGARDDDRSALPLAS